MIFTLFRVRGPVKISWLNPQLQVGTILKLYLLSQCHIQPSFSVSKEEDCTASLSNLFQCLTTLVRFLGFLFVFLSI